MEKKEVLDFLSSHIPATISTVNTVTFQPESALVAIAELESLEIIFTTLKGSRKYMNLLQNNKVAMVIGWEEKSQNWATMQYEGIAFQVQPEEEHFYKEIFQAKKGTPCTKEFLNKPGMQLFKITPTWIGFSRFPLGKKPNVIEIRHF